MRHFLRLSLGVASLALVVAALFMVFIYVPTDGVQGIVQRIFYFHVPCAWVAFAGFGLAAACGAFYLWLDHQIWDDLSYAAVEVGMVFCTLVLATGSLWAKPIWGAWWTWDSRLTTTFILWLLYGGYLLMRVFADANMQVARYAAVVAIVGALDLPIIIISVRIWRTIHPAVLITREGHHGLEDPRMVATLLIATAAFTVFFAWLLWLRFETLRLNGRVAALAMKIALRRTEDRV